MVDDEPPYTYHPEVRPYRGIERALEHHNELLATIAAQSAELEALRAEVAPVRHWYESDEHPARGDVDILKDIVADLQSDRAENLKLRARVAALEEFTADISSCLGDLLCDEEIGEPDANEDPMIDLLRRSRALINQNGEAG